MYCSNCGNPIPDNSKFCKFCGDKVKNVYSYPVNEENEKTNLVSSNIAFQNRTGEDIMLLLSAVMLMAIVLCYLLPVVEIKSYTDEKEYNIFSLTQDIIYNNKYSLRYAMDSRCTGDGPTVTLLDDASITSEGYLYQGQEDWNENVSVFEYMYQKSLKIGDASYTEDMYKISLVFYWIALFATVINVILIVYLIMMIVRRRNFMDGVVTQILILEGARSAIIILLVKTIVKAAPEVFQYYNYWFGDYETADVTIEPFCLLPFALLFIVMIIKNIYFKEK